ncbi:hypothetical protein [Xanthobacter sp. KR7-225]|uniref:hypothetical protein n=1 Tax=Xanthobacter sp. KR7-225 TaxID=3156613 RepID=UPI0032B39F30
MTLLYALAALVEGSALGQMARASVWLYPVANLAHVLGAALVVGAIATFDIAVLRRVPAARGLVRAGIPVAAAGLVLVLVSGTVLFAAEAGPLVRNGVFLAKLGVIALGILNVTLFHLAISGALKRGEVPATARLFAAISLTAWIAALLLGRAIAYV